MISIGVVMGIAILLFNSVLEEDWVRNPGCDDEFFGEKLVCFLLEMSQMEELLIVCRFCSLRLLRFFFA